MTNKQRLYVPSYASKVLAEFGFTFSKSKGQNFLIDGNIIKAIRKGAMIGPEDLVIEIGTGIGVLTEELALYAKKVVAVEIDERLLPILEVTLADYDNIEILHQDALTVDFQHLIHEVCQRESAKLVANLPYNVATAIVTSLLECRAPFSSLTFMVQKEVGERMIAQPGTKAYGSLSVFVQYFTDPKILLTIPKTVFIPQPKIDSVVVHLSPKETPDINEDLFFGLVRSGFMKRRKTITNSLTTGTVDCSKERLNEALNRLEIDPKSRAENLSVGDYIRLAEVLDDSCLSEGIKGINEVENL